MIGRIIIGIIPVVVGFFMVKKPQLALDFIGTINFAEKAFAGGSRSFYKLLGVILTMIGFLIITNLHLGFLNWFGGLFVF